MFSFLLAVCTALSLTMTSCAAQEGPEEDANPSPVSAVSQELPFTDIPADAWYADEVQYCYENGIFAGTSDTAFSPDDTLTRAMLVTILYRAAGSPSLDNENLGYPFSDVRGTAGMRTGSTGAGWRASWAGYGNNAFGPDDPLTREQAVTILWRYAGSPTASSGTFSDSAGLADWAVSAAGWAQAMGLLTGWADSSLQPQTPLTRAEAAALLARYLEGGETTTDGSSSILVAYFSATGTTRPLAEHAADLLNAGSMRSSRRTPYTNEDLDYTKPDSRSQVEGDDPDARPAIDGSVENMAEYEVILLGYPIWNGQAPKIISTFLESYDLSGKTIVPFCTSHSSGIGSSDDNLHSLAPDANCKRAPALPAEPAGRRSSSGSRAWDCPRPRRAPRRSLTLRPALSC